MDIQEFIYNKKDEIDNEWKNNQRDEWTNGYYSERVDFIQVGVDDEW